MSNSFDEIFTSLIKEYEKNPDVDIDALIKAQCEKEGISPEGQKNIEQALSMVDDLHQSEMSLEEAKANDYTRQDWLQDQLDEITKDLPDEQKDIAVQAIAEAQGKVIEQMKSVSEDAVVEEIGEAREVNDDSAKKEEKEQ